MLNERIKSIGRIGFWLAAALEDPCVCDEMKADIRAWFGAEPQTVRDADDLEDVAKAIFDVLSPGVAYGPDDAFWYRKAARAALAVSRPTQAPQRGQVTAEQAAIDVARERKAKEERDRLETKPIWDRSDWPSDGFINDTD